MGWPGRIAWPACPDMGGRMTGPPGPERMGTPCCGRGTYGPEPAPEPGVGPDAGGRSGIPPGTIGRAGATGAGFRAVGGTARVVGATGAATVGAAGVAVIGGGGTAAGATTGGASAVERIGGRSIRRPADGGAGGTAGVANMVSGWPGLRGTAVADPDTAVIVAALDAGAETIAVFASSLGFSAVDPAGVTTTTAGGSGLAAASAGRAEKCAFTLRTQPSSTALE